HPRAPQFVRLAHRQQCKTAAASVGQAGYRRPLRRATADHEPRRIGLVECPFFFGSTNAVAPLGPAPSSVRPKLARAGDPASGRARRRARVDPVELRGGDQAVDGSRVLAALSEQAKVQFLRRRRRPAAPLGGVVRDARLPVIEEAGECVPTVEAVIALVVSLFLESLARRSQPATRLMSGRLRSWRPRARSCWRQAARHCATTATTGEWATLICRVPVSAKPILSGGPSLCDRKSQFIAICMFIGAVTYGEPHRQKKRYFFTRSAASVRKVRKWTTSRSNPIFEPISEPERMWNFGATPAN